MKTNPMKPDHVARRRALAGGLAGLAGGLASVVLPLRRLVPLLPLVPLVRPSAAFAQGAPASARASAPATGSANAPKVVASFSILADMLRQIAPPDFEITALVGADADAHVFAPTPADGRRLAAADLVVVNGLGFEGWIDRLIKASGYRGTVVVASQGIAARKEAASHGHTGGPAQGHKHQHGSLDPHAWQDLAHARRYVATIRAALARRWPERAAEIAARSAEYTARIDALDRRLRELLAAVPREQRRVMTSHDAFGYLGAAYGIDFIAPHGWSTGAEPSAAAVARLVRQLREQRVRAVFVENISDPRLVQRIAGESGARVGGTLYSDALSAPGGPAGNYLKMFEHNVSSIAHALAAPR